MDETQLGRLKALFDEFGVDYGVHEGPNPEPDRAGRIPRVPDGEKWLITGEGKGYGGFFACFDFTAKGRFLRYGVWE